MKKQYLTFSQRVEVYNFLKTVGEPNGEHWVYKEGWSDTKVAEKFQYTQGNVITVRMELGKLTSAPHGPYGIKVKDLEATVIRHEESIADLYKKLNELGSKITSLTLGSKFRVNT
jgi:hypothetical protein